MKKMLFLAAVLCVSSGAGAVDYLISSEKSEPPVIIIHEPYGRGHYMPYPPPPPPRPYFRDDSGSGQSIRFGQNTIRFSNSPPDTVESRSVGGYGYYEDAYPPPRRYRPAPPPRAYYWRR